MDNYLNFNSSLRALRDTNELTWHRLQNLEAIVDELTRQLRIADTDNYLLRQAYDEVAIKLFQLRIANTD